MANQERENTSSQPAGATLRAGPIFSRFALREIPESCLEHVIELARHSPSEWNFQPWRWIVVRNESGKRLLEASTYIKVPLSSAPVILVCLADTQAWKSAPQHLQEMVANKKMTEQEARAALHKIGEYYSISPEIARRAALANSFIALHQMLVAAADCKLSAYWVTEFDELRVKTHFHIPDHFLVTALLAIGYLDEALTSHTPKLPIHSLVYKEKFGEAFEGCCEDSSEGAPSK